MKYRQQSVGFSLLELMVVIAIIAILATLAMPSNVGRITQKRMVETIELVEPYKAYVAASYLANSGTFPADNAAAGMPDPDKIKGNYLRKLEIRDGVMHLTLGQKLPASLHDKILSIRPVYVKDEPSAPISWICGNEKVPQGMFAAGTNLTDLDVSFLPGRCR
ncbi:pilin [Arenicella xantha]|uniref:Type IV pilus assembly protein PilA n=1 Tax=Arenicella xantha TaxID=644221 RepID=A0A395JG82_9GAMM|nr:pilin [Arenicella xantha]RBP48866.1 type IV pilus assembly protein PilA [Arenicella xantha]